MAYIYNLSDAWNDAGVTFTAIKMNVLDTASNAASLLMDLQTGGVSFFRVQKNGLVEAGRFGVTGQNGMQFNPATGQLSLSRSADGGTVIALNAPSNNISAGSFILGSDTILVRDGAANTLALRNGTNAQTFRAYNTFTDASNYERGYVRYASNVLQIGHEGAGTGNNSRTIQFQTAGFNPLALDANSATFSVNLLCSTAFQEFSERGTAPTAPATNSVRIYAEDNGSGKTRLMARFATGAAVQIAIEP
jgi:hypothetical protein